MSATAPISARLIPGGAPSAGLRQYHGVAIRTASGAYDLALPPAMPAAEAATVAALLSAGPALIEAIEGMLAAFESDDPRADRAGWKMQARRAVYLARGGR